MAVYPTYAVTIVTFNSARFIGQCLRHVLAQEEPARAVVVVDNASSDETAAVLREFEHLVTVVYNRENVGFAAGQNQAMALAADADWLLALNPDVRLTAGFAGALLEAAQMDPAVGSVCGKLLGMTAALEIPAEPILDSTGIFFTPNLRHFDRGSQVADRGQYEEFEYVFGGTGAACFYRRLMLKDISINGEFFDVDFFAYREDADVAWRAQICGWKCLYTPRAVAYHVRNVLPERRSALSAAINMHSVKNRWLMRIKNMSGDLYARHWLAITLRDGVVIGGCLLREFSSLRAFVLVARLWRGTWRKRSIIMSKRRSSDEYMAAWFAEQPVSFPADLMAQAIYTQRTGAHD